MACSLDNNTTLQDTRLDSNNFEFSERISQPASSFKEEKGVSKNNSLIMEDIWALGTRMSFDAVAHLIEKLLTSDKRPLPQQLLDANILCEPSTIARQLHQTLRELKFKQNAVLLSRKMRTRPGRGVLERSHILHGDESAQFRERTVQLEANIRRHIHSLTRVKSSPVNAITQSLVYMHNRDDTQ